MNNAEKTARDMVGDGNLPNKYWVSTSNDYWVEVSKGTYDWASDRRKFKVIGETYGPYNTFHAALEKAQSIELVPPPDDNYLHTVIIEDRLSGEVYMRAYREVRRPQYHEDENFETEFTKEEMEKRGYRFE